MKGKAKLERKQDGKYHIWVRNRFWQRWKPLEICGEQVSFRTMAEFGDVTKIECFDRILVKFDRYSGMEH